MAEKYPPPRGRLGCSRDNERVDVEHRPGTVDHVPWGERAWPAMVGKVRSLWTHVSPQGCKDEKRRDADCTRCVGRRVQGLGFGVWGLGFGVWDLGFRVCGLGFRVED